MPKIIEDLRDTLLTKAKELIFSAEGEELTIRAVASKAGVAVGTVYNYFPSKDALLGAVIVNDWMESLRRMQEQTLRAENVLCGLRSIYSGLREFSETYSPVWLRQSPKSGEPGFLHRRRMQLTEQLRAIITPLVARFQPDYYPLLPGVLAELILSACGNGTEFDDAIPIFIKLLS